MPTVRRLAGILAADVAGYSRLMGKDEEGTHERLKTHLGELVHPKITEHRGRVIKNTGDGLLAEFPSVVDAVRCAVEVQRGMAERNASIAASERIEFRIGINLGDVIVEQEDIYGDGVNLAARLEALAEPGGICVSRVVHDQVRDRLPYPFEDGGERTIRNFARPVQVYAIGRAAIASLLLLTAVHHASNPIASSVAPRLSIVILPFLNLSHDADVDYLVDGIVDSLITDLARALPGSFVISRSTAFTYKGRSVPIRQVGLELGVRYVLEGSVLADPTRVRVSVQLIDANTDEHLWAERFDKERRDIMEVQDEIVARLSRGVGIEMVRTEAGRGNSGDAIDLVMRARALVHVIDLKRQDTAIRAIELFRRALKFDPDNVDALVGIAVVRVYEVINLFRVEAQDALLEAESSISRAIMLAPDHIGALNARAVLLRARGQFAEAMVAVETVIARNPGDPMAYKEMGLNNLYLGRTQQAADWFRRANRVAPSDPARWTWLQGLGRALMQLGRDEEAIDALRQAMDSNPNYLRGKAWLAAAEALAGNQARARLHLAEYVAVEREMTVQRFAAERSSVPISSVSPIYRREIERILEGLRKAGMPEE